MNDARPSNRIRALRAPLSTIVPIIAGLGALAVVAQSEAPPKKTIPLHNAARLLGVDEAVAVKDPDLAKASHDLLEIHDEYQRHLQQAGGQTGGTPAFQSSNALARIVDGKVVIEAVATSDARALAAELEGLGLEDTAVSGWMVSGRLAISTIPALKDVQSLKLARPVKAMTQVGDATSQGDVAMGADVARSSFGIDGTGVTVGVLSDSFDCLGGAAAGVASGDLPAGIRVLQEGPCPAADEARALAEVIHDIAPGAAIAVHSAVNGQPSFAQGIIDLANAGAHVITDDVIYFAEPMFQDGIVAQAVARAKALGVSYFSAAGNQARQSYESPFRPSGQFVDIGFGPAEAHDFDPGPGVDTCQRITIPAGRRLIMDLQWDQPFFSVSGPPGSQSDLDILLTNEGCTALVAGSASPNVGADPVEVFAFSNEGPDTTFGVILLRSSGPDPGLLKTVLFGSGPSSPITIDEYGTGSGSSFGHNNSLGGLGVGAAFYAKTPALGTTRPLIEDFSSAGGVPILFDTRGNRLPAPEVRAQPGITAVDGTDSTLFRGGDTAEGGFPSFLGTSAAAAHAAGVAALMKDRSPSLTPDRIYGALQETAIDMDDPGTTGFDTGFDFGTGHGLIQAVDALPLATTTLPPPTTTRGDEGTCCDSTTTTTITLAPTTTTTTELPTTTTTTLPPPTTTTLPPPTTTTLPPPTTTTLPPPTTTTLPPPTTTTLPPPVPPSADLARQQLVCQRTTCDILLTCNQPVGTVCVSQVDLFVTPAALRSSADTAVKAPKRIKFAGGVSNVPAGSTSSVTLKVTKRGRRIIASTKKKTLRGVAEIRNSPGSLIATIPGIKIRLRK